MASIQAKRGQELRVIQKKKSYRSDPFQPDPEKEIPKKLQRNAKN